MRDRFTIDLLRRLYSGMPRIALALICMMSVNIRVTWATPPTCDFPGQTQMLLVQLFMGLDMPNNSTVTPKAWNAFLGSVVTPAFPNGFTVYDAYGQWWNPQTRSIDREQSKVIVIAVTDSQRARAGISEVADAYKKQFRQLSVGIVSSDTCAAF